MKWLLVTVLLLAAQAASAQPCDPLPNGIGIYFDQQGCDYCAMPALYSTVTGYVLATNVDPSLGGISVFELKLLIDPVPFGLIERVTSANPVNLFPWYSLIPFDTAIAPAMKLFWFEFIWMGSPTRFGLGPYLPSSRHGTTPMMLAANDPALWVPLRPSIQNVPWPGEEYGYTVAWAGNCPIAAEETSWGEIKSLYR